MFNLAIDGKLRACDLTRLRAKNLSRSSCHICMPAAMMMEMVRIHNSMTVKRGYLKFIIIFLMLHDRNFIKYLPFAITARDWFPVCRNG